MIVRVSANAAWLRRGWHRGQLSLDDPQTEEHSPPDQAAAVSSTGNELEVVRDAESAQLLDEPFGVGAVDVGGANGHDVVDAASRRAALDDDRWAVAVRVGAIDAKDRSAGDVVAGESHRHSKDVGVPGGDIHRTVGPRRQAADPPILPVGLGPVVLVPEGNEVE